MPVLSPSFAVAQQPPRQRGPRAQGFCKNICFSLKGIANKNRLWYNGRNNPAFNNLEEEK